MTSKDCLGCSPYFNVVVDGFFLLSNYMYFAPDKLLANGQQSALGNLLWTSLAFPVKGDSWCLEKVVSDILGLVDSVWHLPDKQVEFLGK